MADANAVITMEQIREIADLQARMKTVEARIPASEKQQVEVGVLTVTVGRVEASVNNINETVGSLNKAISSLELSQKLAEQGFLKMEERLTSFDKKIDKLADQINQRLEENQKKICTVDEKSKVDLIPAFKAFMSKNGFSIFMFFITIGAILYGIIEGGK